MISSFYSNDELSALGIAAFGKNVLISRNARFYNPEQLFIGNDVRIDDFCIFSGDIKLGNHVHISAYTALYGKFGISIDDYSGLSPRCTIFSATDDFSGDFLVGPMVNKAFTNIMGGEVIIGKYCQLGCNCVVLPKLVIAEGVAIGAMSLINRTLDPWGIYAGIPVRLIKERSKTMLSFVE